MKYIPAALLNERKRRINAESYAAVLLFTRTAGLLNVLLLSWTISRASISWTIFAPLLFLQQGMAAPSALLEVDPLY